MEGSVDGETAKSLSRYRSGKKRVKTKARMAKPSKSRWRGVLGHYCSSRQEGFQIK